MKDILERLLVKLTSVKTWIVIFAMVLTTYIVFNKEYEFATLAYILVGIIATYCGVNVFEKSLLKKEE